MKNNESWDVPNSFHKGILDALDKIEQMPEKKRSGIRRMSLVIPILAVLCVLSLGAYAAVNWLNPKLAEVMGIDESTVETDTKQANELKGMVADVNKSATDNGLTITAVQTIGDKNGVYILLELSAEDKSILETANWFEEFEVTVGGEDVSMEGGLLDSYDEDLEKNGVIYYQFWITQIYDAMDLSGKEISIHLKDLYDNPYRNISVEGTWDLSWTLEYTDSIRTFDLNKTVELVGHEFEITKFELSPISYNLIITCPEFKDLVNEHSDIAIDIQSFIMADGSELDSYGGGPGAKGFTDENTSQNKTMFSNILDVENVVGIKLRIDKYENRECIESEIFEIYF